MFYAQNGDRIVIVDSVTSLHLCTTPTNPYKFSRKHFVRFQEDFQTLDNGSTRLHGACGNRKRCNVYPLDSVCDHLWMIHHAHYKYNFRSRDTKQAISRPTATFCLIISLLTCSILCLQCFDTVGWATGRASGL